MSLHGLLHRALMPARTLTTRTTTTTNLGPAVASRSAWMLSNGQQCVSITSLAPSMSKATTRIGPMAVLVARNARRFFTTSDCQHSRETSKAEDVTGTRQKRQSALEEQEPEQRDLENEQKTSESQVQLPAKLSKEGQGDSAGLKEIWRLVQIARPEFRWLFFAFSLLAVASLISMTIPYAIGKVMDVANAAAEGKEARVVGVAVHQFLFGLAAIFTVGAMANYGSIILLRVLGERVVARLRSQLYRRIYTQDAEFFDANRVGDLMSRLTLDTSIVSKAVTQNLSHGLSNLCISITGLGVMLWTSPKLTGLLLLMFPPAAVGTVFYGIAIRNISKALQKTMGSLTKTVEERLGNVKTTQAFVGEIQEVHHYNKQVRNVFTLGRKEARVQALFHASTGWAGDMMVIAILLFGMTAIKSSILSSGDLTSFMLYTVFTGSGLFGLSGFYSELMKGAGAGGRLFELQDKQPALGQTMGASIESAKGAIKFEDVSFAYPTRPGVTIFDNLTFEIPSGSNVCVVSPSGGGKSTIASLLLRLYSPTSGSISISGQDISKVNAKSLRRRIGMVSQEPILFSGSLAENISYGKPTATRAEIIAAAKKANCDFIDNMPAGFDTQVGARGSQMSGGQKQRIAIARALLKDPDILILDEATSALDARSEMLVGEALAEVMRGQCTTISIAHRLSTIKRSDQVIVLNEGRVVEVGTYRQLAADKNSAFHKLMEWQLAETDDVEDVEAEEDGQREDIGKP